MNTRPDLQILDATAHLVVGHDIVHQRQMAHDLAECASSLRMINDAEMRWVARGVAQEVGVLRDYHTPFAFGKRQVIFVRRAEQTSIGGRRHIDPAPTEARGYGRGHVLVKMILYRRRSSRSAAAPTDPDRFAAAAPEQTHRPRAAR